MEAVRSEKERAGSLEDYKFPMPAQSAQNVREQLHGISTRLDYILSATSFLEDHSDDEEPICHDLQWVAGLTRFVVEEVVDSINGLERHLPE